MKVALDWSHKEDKIAVYDGKKLRKSVPKLKSGDQVFVENLPAKYAQQWLKDGIEIYRCRPNDTSEFRDRLNMPKTDQLDALFIWKLANEYPKLFRQWTGDPVLYSLYKMFKEIQKDRIRQSNRVWAKEEPIAKGVLHDLEAIEKKIAKAMKVELEKYQIWSWLQQIKGINVVTAAGLVAFIDKIGIENLKQVSSLWHYFGVHVEDGVAARAKRGAAMSYNPDAKTLVLGIIADNFIRQRTPLYRKIYDTERNDS